MLETSSAPETTFAAVEFKLREIVVFFSDFIWHVLKVTFCGLSICSIKLECSVVKTCGLSREMLSERKKKHMKIFCFRKNCTHKKNVQ